MKNASKFLGLSLAVAAMLLTACTKKPVRPDPTTTAMGPGTNDINPEAVALPGENINLENRSGESPDAANKSVVEPIYFALDRFAVAPAERPMDAPPWVGAVYTDAGGTRWLELDLPALARESRFLEVGA